MFKNITLVLYHEDNLFTPSVPSYLHPGQGS